MPMVENFLPELGQFTRQLADECQRGSIADWRVFSQRVRDFYSPAMMDKIEPVVPGWGRMASYADQQTLIHVTSVLTALLLLPEYRNATAEQQTLLEWIVLFHDVAKEAQPGKHDYVHAFRSAAITAKALARVGFPVTDVFLTQIDSWFMLTYNAVYDHQGHAEMIQDNRKLPAIMSGIDQLYGTNAPAGWVIKAILLHLSIITDPNYPILAPLSLPEMKACVDSTLFPFLKAMMLVDTDGWNLFDAQTQRDQRAQTLVAFDRLNAH
jgi:hypothetical protein